MEQHARNRAEAFAIHTQTENDRIIALAGNPNVGKSTVFNALTGMNQHTGNWPGKTVESAQGGYRFEGESYLLVDLPGAYSLKAHSVEEEVARDFLLFAGVDATVVVCDATCLERNLNLLLQVMEITDRVVVCVNLLDEAEKKNIQIDLAALEAELGVPVVGASARAGEGLRELQEAVAALCDGRTIASPCKVCYERPLEDAISRLGLTAAGLDASFSSRWVALRLLEGDPSLFEGVQRHLGVDLQSNAALSSAVLETRKMLEQENILTEFLEDRVVSSVVRAAEKISKTACPCGACHACQRDRKLDRILTSKRTGIPIMLALLCMVFWLTITGANYPSQLLSNGLFWIQDQLTILFFYLGAPEWLHGALVLGVYRVLAWIVSVMLPPMAIFFPLFTLLEDFGYLPRVAFNLDHQFKKAKTCGKQALTMCMGFGCNAVGVVGCRIIDSPRERLIAILTNNFVPCNGRFPPPQLGETNEQQVIRTCCSHVWTRFKGDAGGDQAIGRRYALLGFSDWLKSGRSPLASAPL